MNEILSNLGRLSDFKGRERRARFWPYVGIVLAAVMLTAGIVMSIVMAVSGPSFGIGPSSDPMAIMRPIFWTDGVILLIVIGLLAAAVSRRLHDGGMRAFWGLLPLPFVVAAIVIMPRVFASIADDGSNMIWLPVLFLNNGLYMATLVTLIVLLCRPSTKGENKYGAEPA